VKSKVKVLVDVGLVEGEIPGTEKADFELATNTCNTLLKLCEKKIKAGTYTEQFRIPNDNNIFQTLMELIVKGNCSSVFVLYLFKLGQASENICNKAVLVYCICSSLVLQ